VKDKRILVTGASNGLGRAAAIAFESKGSRLALVARSRDKLNSIISSYNKSDLHLSYDMDLLITSNINELCKDIIDKWGGIDVILHCIGGSLGVNDTLVEWEDFIKVLNGNFGIASQINKHLVPAMKKQGSGNIIHVGSIVAYEALGSVPYGTSKAALSGYVRSLGKELLEDGIIVSGILPGAFYGEDGAMSRYKYYKPEEYKEYVETLPQQRMPEANEYLPILYLLSNSESKVMSGSLITMDGSQGQAYYNFSS
jgi:3-oxoacyl-[acyl-carrier protein] reductase